MKPSEYGKIFSKNLKRIAYEHQRSQADIARDLGLKQGTVSTWMTGTRVPRMDKIDMLCDYFNVPRSALMEPHTEDYYQKYLNGQPLPLDNTTLKPYYYNDQTAKIAQEIFDNTDLGWLHHNVPKMPPEDIAVLKKMAEALYKKEFPDDN